MSSKLSDADIGKALDKSEIRVMETYIKEAVGGTYVDRRIPKEDFERYRNIYRETIIRVNAYDPFKTEITQTLDGIEDALLGIKNKL